LSQGQGDVTGVVKETESRGLSQAQGLQGLQDLAGLSQGDTIGGVVVFVFVLVF
jgi:hypothetical protein